MKKLYLLGLACCLSGSMFAQSDYVTPVEVQEMVAQGVSPNGRYVSGQDMLGSVVYLYDVVNGEKKEFMMFGTGNGNNVSNNGIVVGYDLSGASQVGCLLINGAPVYPRGLNISGQQSSIDGITPDGTRACGYKSGGGSVLYTPIVVDINEDGTVKNPVNLPYPRKDIFDEAPQWVNAIAISDDGKTIAGFVLSGNGFFCYPIVYREDENGKWSYTEPTMDLFNPEHLPLPVWPDVVWGENGAPAQPNAIDFMTPEERAAFEEAVKQNPNMAGEAYKFLTDEEYKRYEEAIRQFDKDALDYINPLIDAYWHQCYIMGRDIVCLENFITVSHDGSEIAVVKITPDSGMLPQAYTPEVITVATSDIREIPIGKENMIIPRQILSDGTIVAVSSPNDFIPFVCYVCEPGQDEFITLNDFLEQNIPSYLPWLEDSDLTQYGIIGYDENSDAIYGFYTVTGYVWMSDKYETIAGGVPLGDGYTYVYFNKEGYEINGIGQIEMDPATEEAAPVYYNLQGVRVANPTSGIYIVNGKKVLVR